MEASTPNSPGGRRDHADRPAERYAQVALVLTLSVLGIAIAYFFCLYLLAH